VKVRRRSPRFLAIVVGVLASATCDNPVEPTGSPGITIVAGADVADSIDARPAQELLVEVHTISGLLARHAVVRFSGLPTDGGPYPPTSVRVGRIDDAPIRALAVDTTDGSGQARVVIALGAVAGPGGVEVTVPELGFADTARYTIRPGHAVRVVCEPADTVVYQSRSFALRASVRDRYGNPRPDPVTFEADSASASVSPAGTVTSEELGRARVRIGDGAGHADTTWVSVIPQGTIAATSATGIVIVDLDGSNRRNLPGVAAATWLDWNPTGDTLVFASPDNDSWLYVTNTTGPPRRLITAPTGLLSEYWPQYSGDGQWIYFSGRTNYQNQAIWRVRADGSSPALIGPASGYASLDSDPAPSSDGSRVAYVSNRCCVPDYGLFLLYAQTGVIDSLAPGALSPRWSPGDSLIGFIFHGVFVIRPDGQSLRRLTAIGQNYYQEFDWSPTGEWMIARGPSGHLDLIRLADGLILTLPYFTDLDRPAWRP
jgi:Tol biopolymer transport system component